MNLPESFAEMFGSLLGKAEYGAFFDALSGQRTWGLRVNTLKISTDQYLARTSFPLRPVPWTRDGFRYEGDFFPGRHPDYHAGMYYLQDPGAMLAAELLDPQPGDRVLDLCAAPGGKTVQLAAMMRNTGLLVANDISPKRVKPLCRNLEGLGVACAVVLKETPERLAAAFPSFYDRILIDAPCSGEGMFRKDEKAIGSWLRHGPDSFVPVQQSLLEAAWTMLKPGGHVAYATCTFNPDENERNIVWALDRFPDMMVVPISDLRNGLQPGRPEWAGNRREVAGAVRIWPHLMEGEGLFVTRLQKKQQSGTMERTSNAVGRQCFHAAPPDAVIAWKTFLDSEMAPDARMIASGLPIGGISHIVLSGTLLYSLPGDGSFPATLHAEMPGLLLGEWQNDRFEPSAALLHALEPDAALRRLDFTADSEAARRYLHGETLIREGERGWTAVCVDGYPLGWGKQEDGFMKNRYPKGWRMQ